MYAHMIVGCVHLCSHMWWAACTLHIWLCLQVAPCLWVQVTPCLWVQVMAANKSREAVQVAACRCLAQLCRLGGRAQAQAARGRCPAHSANPMHTYVNPTLKQASVD